jgi:hypothetical protein
VILTEPLSTIFVFSLTLQSASPRLVLYMQLAEDSLSSVPITDSLEKFLVKVLKKVSLRQEGPEILEELATG